MESYPWTLSSSFCSFGFWSCGKGELIEDEWDGFTACCCELLGHTLFPIWHSSWAHWMPSPAFCLARLHTFKCCDLYYLEELPVHLRVEINLCSAVLVAVVK